MSWCEVKRAAQDRKGGRQLWTSYTLHGRKRTEHDDTVVNFFIVLLSA